MFKVFYCLVQKEKILPDSGHLKNKYVHVVIESYKTEYES